MEKDCSKKSCVTSFNFCFWAKLLVAIPAMPIIAMICAMPFSDGLSKIVAAVAGCGLAVYVAMWIDRQPALSRKVFPKRENQ